MNNSEPRRLIKFGNSSFVVSLPKDWIEKNNLSKGDIVYLENLDDVIVLSSKNKKKNSVKTNVTINTDNGNQKDIRREASSAYINNYDELIFEGKDRKKRVETVNYITSGRIGLEVVDQNENQSIVRDILDLNAISFEKITRRLDNIIRSMFEDLREMLGGGNFSELNNDLKNADGEVNKLYFLIWKIIRKCQENPQIAKEMKISLKELSNMQWLSLHMEYMGDEIKGLASLMSLVKADEKCKKKILESIKILEQDYLKALGAYYSNDRQIARKIASMRDIHRNICIKFFTACPSSGAISEKMRGIANCIHNIAKIVAY